MKENLVKVIETYLSNLQNAIDNFPISQVMELATLIQQLPSSNTVYVIGNGGSASTASHMATDLGVGSLHRGNPIRCVSLVENMSIVTAIGNDLDFAKVFSEQIQLLGIKGDLLICFSASGNSKNLINAVDLARSIGVKTVGITGFNGGKLKEICDFSVHLPTPLGSYGLVEDLHSSVSHIVTELIRMS